MVKIWEEGGLVFRAAGKAISVAAHGVRPCINGVDGCKSGKERAEDENCEHRFIEYRQNMLVSLHLLTIIAGHIE